MEARPRANCFAERSACNVTLIRLLSKLLNAVALAFNVVGHAVVGVFLTNRLLMGVQETRAKPYLITGHVLGWPLAALAHARSFGGLKGFARSLLWPCSLGRIWRLAFTVLGLRWVIQETYSKLRPQLAFLEVSHTGTRNVDLRGEIISHEGLPSTGWKGLLNRANELYNLEIITYEVRLRRLPRQFDGFTIAHLSDTHHAPLISAEFTRLCVELALELSPDLVALTGDYQYYSPNVEKGAQLLAPIGEWSRRERGGKGVFAVLGNHDVGSGKARVITALHHAGIPVLDNVHTRLEKDGASLYVAGVADPWSRRSDLGQALAGIPEESCVILLVHVPDYLVEAAGERVDLQLSGHNHGGQIQMPVLGPLLVASRYGRRYVEGFYKRAGTLMYVSRGLGGKPPIRWRARPDITCLVLRTQR
jgi:predicted MPP superfamily phosphohydrolase